MPILCKRKGGFGLKVPQDKGGFLVVNLKGGLNDVDPDLVSQALESMQPEMAKAISAELDLVAEGEIAPDEMKAADKVKAARAAGSMEELRALAEGEDRSTVMKAIEKRAAELEADEG
jgi:hypothetical protein